MRIGGPIYLGHDKRRGIGKSNIETLTLTSVPPVGLLLAITRPTTASAFTPMGDEEFLLLL